MSIEKEKNFVAIIEGLVQTKSLFVQGPTPKFIG